jgi:hypothetical protein
MFGFLFDPVPYVHDPDQGFVGVVFHQPLGVFVPESGFPNLIVDEDGGGLPVASLPCGEAGV